MLSSPDDTVRPATAMLPLPDGLIDGLLQPRSRWGGASGIHSGSLCQIPPRSRSGRCRRSAGTKRLRTKLVAANGVAGLESVGEKGGGSSGLREEKVREGRPPWTGATAGGGGAVMDRRDGGRRGGAMDRGDGAARWRKEGAAMEQRADKGAAATMDWRGGLGRAAAMAAMNGGCGRR